MARLKCDLFYWFGLIGFVTGAILMFVGVGTAYWLVNDDMSVGLFVRCNHQTCIPITATGVETATKALISTGVVLGALATTLAFMFLIRFSHVVQSTKRIPLASCIVSLVGGVLGISGIIVYSMGIGESMLTRFENIFTVQYGYSFIVSIAGSVLLILSGSLIWFGTCRIFKRAALQQRIGIDFTTSHMDPNLGSLDISQYAPPQYETVCQIEADPKLFPPPPDYFELMQLSRSSLSQTEIIVLPPPPVYDNIHVNDEEPPPPPYSATTLQDNSSPKETTN